MFLKISQNRAIAENLGAPPVVSLNYQGQIHLRPYDPKPYIQITDDRFGINFNENDYDGFLIDCEGNEYALGNHIFLKQVTDQNGVNQMYIRLMFLPFDFGGALVSLKITSGALAFYSNTFKLTIDEINKTTRIDTKITENYTNMPEQFRFYQGIRVAFYYNDYLPATEADIYYQISTSQEVNPRISEKYHKQWCFEFADEYTLKRVERSLYRYACYFDFTRNYIVDTPDKEARQGDSNISETFITTNEDELDTILLPSIQPDEPLSLFLASSGTFASSSYLISQGYI
jgi:hypothetical protein